MAGLPVPGKPTRPADPLSHPLAVASHPLAGPTVSEPSRPAPRPSDTPSAHAHEESDPVVRFLRDSVSKQRPKLHRAQVTDDEPGLQALAKAGSWRAAAQLAEALSTKALDQPADRLRYQTCQIAALMKLCLFRQALAVVERLGDLNSANYQFENHGAQYPGQTGSMVPFTLRVLAAQLPFYLEQAPLAFDQLYTILHVCRREIAKHQELLRPKHAPMPARTPPPPVVTPGPDGTELVETIDPLESTSSDTIAAVPSREGSPIVAEPADRSTPTPTPPPQTVPSIAEAPRGVAHRASVSLTVSGMFDEKAGDGMNSSLGVWKARELRVLMVLVSFHSQLGELHTALRLINSLLVLHPRDVGYLSLALRSYLQLGDIKSAERIAAAVESELGGQAALSGQVRMNRGLLMLSTGNFSGAEAEFSAALKIDSSDAAAANNLALCHVYAGHLDRAIQQLEGLIRADCAANLTEETVFNLTTLYDLAYDSATEHKEVIKMLVIRFATDGFDTSVLKLKAPGAQ